MKLGIPFKNTRTLGMIHCGDGFYIGWRLTTAYELFLIHNYLKILCVHICDGLLFVSEYRSNVSTSDKNSFPLLFLPVLNPFFK